MDLRRDSQLLRAHQKYLREGYRACQNTADTSPEIGAMRKIVEKCPSCDRPDMVVTNLQCSECGTEVRGAFAASRFCRLSEPSLQFIETFVRNRGNLKEMERELNVAYATLRTRLNGVIQEMGYEGADVDPGEETVDAEGIEEEAEQPSLVDVMDADDAVTVLADCDDTCSAGQCPHVGETVHRAGAERKSPPSSSAATTATRAV